MSAGNSDLASRNIYARDDYDEVNAQFFSDILRSKTWTALPAGWHNPKSCAAESFVLQAPTFNDASQYALDEGYALGDIKEAILGVVGRWENRPLSWEELTICPSVSTANLVVLSALKTRGYRHICFESPAYFATPVQADLLGFEVQRVAGDCKEDFDVPIELFINSFHGVRKVLWLTQPRFGIGTNQDIKKIQTLASKLESEDIIVIDEAAEQMFPSVLSRLESLNCTVIRTRGLMKGIGLNGMRSAVILHPSDWRGDMEQMLEPSGASLDRFSLRNFLAFAESPSLLPTLLKTANDQARRLRKMVETLALGTWVKPTPLINGYIGSVILNFKNLPGDFDAKRMALLHYCRAERMPIVLRASIGFPHDDSWEAVRMNYFTPDENVEYSTKILINAYECLLAQ